MSNYRDEFGENSYYLISNKGFNGNVLFSNSDDYKTFILDVVDSLLEYKGVILTSYSILPTHFHFIVQNLHKGYVLSDFMRKIQVSYAMYLKNNKNTHGTTRGVPVFDGRFKSKKIEVNDLGNFESYVAFDPINHGICDNIGDWPYTSAHQATNTGYDYQSQIHIKVYHENRSISKKMFPDGEHLL